jgi:hypothetical protein
LVDCDQRLARHRAALEAGTGPGLIAKWTAEIKVKRQDAERRLQADERTRLLTEQEIAAAIAEIGDLGKALREAEPADKAELYLKLGVTAMYDPNKGEVIVESRPSLWGEGLRSIHSALKTGG